MNTHDILEEFLSNNSLMQLATVSDGQPWLCNVYYVHDEEGNLYWTSAREKRRHSREVKNDPRVAVNIVHDDTRKQAIQMTGMAYEVPPEDAVRVDSLYSKKFGDKNRIEAVLADLPEGRAYWMVKPTEVFLWDEFNFPDAPKQQVK